MKNRTLIWLLLGGGAFVLLAVTLLALVITFGEDEGTALGFSDRGTLEVGKRADLAIWDADDPAELAWHIAGYGPRTVSSFASWRVRINWWSRTPRATSAGF